MPNAPTPRNHRSITFIHTSDWQLGKPFASITDPAKRARVQQERIEAIRRIGAVVRDRDARFVVVAGDLFDSPTPARPRNSASGSPRSRPRAGRCRADLGVLTLYGTCVHFQLIPQP